MKGIKLIITFGVIVAIVPFLGFPSSWKTFLFAVLGSAIAFTAYYVLREHANEYQEKQDTQSSADTSVVAHE